MNARKTLDRRPGANPEIRAIGDDLAFQFDIAGLPTRMKLYLRCDASGEVMASIASGFEALQRHDAGR